ncbi:MAG: Fe-S cluster assembly protein SufD, partial [Thiothrix sp.]
MKPNDILHHYRQLASAQTAVAHDWHHPRQLHAAMQMQELPLPERRHENWRYTPLTPLLDTAFQPAVLEKDLLFADDLEQLRLTPADNPRIVLHNGFYLPALSNVPENSAIKIESLPAALANGDHTVQAHLGELSGEHAHLFTALNTAMLNAGVVVRIAANTQLTQPLEIIHVSLSFASTYLAQPRLFIWLDAGAHVSIVEHYTHLADVLCLHNSVTEIFLQEGARVQHSRLQNESRRTRHLANLYVQQAAHSHYHNTTLAFGGAWSRTESHIRFSGAGATCQLNGFYLAGDKQSHDMHLHIVHHPPQCTSRSHFKGILQGHSKAVFDGNIEIKPNAQQSDARLSNANLLLSHDADIATKPRLEIYADDVQCSHGTTVGQLDAEMLFYLRARGIPHAQAVQMICAGFAEEIIATAQCPALQEYAHALLKQQLT